MFDVIIIGAGIIGSFLARELSKYDLQTLVLEKDSDVADETTMANSAIAHSGYDPLPGTFKATMNVRGNKILPQIAKELDVPFDKCGTLTIAFSEEEKGRLEELLLRAKANDVKARIIGKEELFKMEPKVNPLAVGALYCKDGGIVNPFLLSVHAMENAVDNGVLLHLNEEVLSLRKKEEGHWIIETSLGRYESRIVINAAGVYSDRIAKMAGDITWEIRPRKGEYYVLDHHEKGLVNHVLFSLPSVKGKGVLFTKTTSGNYLVGPSSEEVLDRDDLSTDSLTLAAIKEQALRLVPSIPFKASIRVYSGLRATPSNHDFILGPQNGDDSFLNAAGIESPGLVSASAIGEYVVTKHVLPCLKPKKKENYTPYVRPYAHPKEMDAHERDAFIKQHPKYGHIVCVCEQISEGEIEEALSRSVPCLTIKAVKKRTRAGFGKCQGGFCLASVLTILAKKGNLSLTDIDYGKKGSPILLAKARKGGKR